MKNKIEITTSEIFDYDIIVKKNKNNFFVSIKELNLFASGITINDAFLKLEKELAKLKSNYKNFNHKNIINSKLKKDSIQSNGVWIFILKVFIFFICLTLSIMFATSFVSKKISQVSIIEILKSEKNKAVGLLNNEKKNIDELNNILTKLEPYYLELEKFYERRRK